MVGHYGSVVSCKEPNVLYNLPFCDIGVGNSDDCKELDFHEAFGALLVL